MEVECPGRDKGAGWWREEGKGVEGMKEYRNASGTFDYRAGRLFSPSYHKTGAVAQWLAGCAGDLVKAPTVGSSSMEERERQRGEDYFG